MAFEVALLDAVGIPLSLRIAREAGHLRQLGLSYTAIAAHLGVTDKTAAKAVAARAPD